jgi:hypothetical protein
MRGIYDPELYDYVTPKSFNGDVEWYRRKAAHSRMTRMNSSLKRCVYECPRRVRGAQAPQSLLMTLRA